MKVKMFWTKPNSISSIFKRMLQKNKCRKNKHKMVYNGDIYLRGIRFKTYKCKYCEKRLNIESMIQNDKVENTNDHTCYKCKHYNLDNYYCDKYKEKMDNPPTSGFCFGFVNTGN